MSRNLLNTLFCDSKICSLVKIVHVDFKNMYVNTNQLIIIGIHFTHTRSMIQIYFKFRHENNEVAN